jgi:hypothetical protein
LGQPFYTSKQDVQFIPVMRLHDKPVAMEDKSMLIAFDSTQQALRAEMLLEYAEIEIDICPTPKEITAGCALSIDFPDEELEQVRNVIVQENVEIRGIFKACAEGYEQVEG